MSTFRRLFSTISLAVSALSGLIALASLIVLREPVPRVSATDSVSGLSRFVADHVELFLWGLLTYSVACVLSSIGLMYRRAWARGSWMALLSLGVVWCLSAMLLELWFMAPPAEPAGAGFLPSFSRLNSMIVVPAGLLSGTLLTWLWSRVRRLPD
jgi:hypothetical protein